ncbi:serine-rich coiled-coil domain-containing protein 2 [Megalops cyprinoides]|uniref:serine-rich coiled-coil domain-containing protein 2 n=1 Tax=Megalops cyprinoides TaxID=118141 RepID=UPI0018652C90|nr:serine-rich coiled-coil domain-containing protein 2 [Megalops cyprinoides]
MEQKVLCKPIMVSRLPKFGARPPAGTSPLANGSVQSAAAPEAKCPPPGRQNGMVRMSPFSLRWKKDGGDSAGQPSPEAPECEDDSAGHRPRQQVSAPREIKKPSTPTIKARRLTTATGPASPKAVAQTPRSGPRAVPKAALNGAGGRGAGRAGGGLVRPRAGSSSTRSSSRDSLSQSSDSLKSLPPDSMVRSQSFTHARQLLPPSNPPISRSFSFTRAVELAKPLADTRLRTRTPLLHPTGGPSRPGVPPGCSTPPSPLKKLLLPSLGCRLSRPRPFLTPARPGNGGSDSAETSPGTSDPLSEAERVAPTLPSHPEPGAMRYPSEDMSLSSASSLERNDTSEDFLDDFDNLGDGGMLLQPCPPDDGVPDNQQPGTPTRPRLRGFLSDAMDWAGVGLPGGLDDSRSLALSPEVDFPHGSSLELSPSNSSGGTYMWDEEGLEPLGPAHPCASFDSDINSMDLLDHLESCDLEDDDLMLDVDLPEDGSLHSDADGMSHLERSERGGRQGPWRRRPHRWSGSDHFHNDNRGALFPQFDGFPGPGLARMGPRALRDGHAVVLDELTLRHMAQDCSSVKTQLLKLKNLLQMEDGGVLQDALLSGVLSPESSEDSNTALQVEELMGEVQDLREELRRKEKTITQLTQQVSAPAHAPRCQCQQRAPAGRGERRTHHDKATQTPWRGHAPQILQPTKHSLSDPHPAQRLANSAPCEARCDVRLTRDQPSTGSQSDAAAAKAPPHDPDELSRLLSAHLNINGTRGLAGSLRPPETPRPPTPHTPRLHRKGLVTAPPPGLHGAGAAALRTLPPPSHGLPCFSAGAQPPSPALPRVPYGHPPPQKHGDAPGPSKPKARGLTLPNHSRLPKPKIH